MLFKHDHFEEEFLKSDIRLQIIVYAVDAFCQSKFAKELVVTDVWRDDPNSVHGDYRGLDFRIITKVGKEYFTGTEVDEIIKFCDHFKYDENRPNYSCLFVHDAGSGKHGHVQVAPNNRLVIIA